MTLTLIRHAPVIADWDTRLSSSALGEWIADYDRAPIDTALPDAAVQQILQKADHIVASSLSRTHDSLGILGITPDTVDPLFDEAPIPSSKGHFLRLKPNQWLVWYRVLWMAGLLRGDASFRAVRTRAEQAADRLIALAGEHGDVVLMGHGGMNHLIGRVLRKQGWRVAKKGGVKNWGFWRFLVGSE